MARSCACHYFITVRLWRDAAHRRQNRRRASTASSYLAPRSASFAFRLPADAGAFFLFA